MTIRKSVLSLMMLTVSSVGLYSYAAVGPQKVVHVLPVNWDARPGSEGWKVLLNSAGKDIQAVKRGLQQVQNSAWDILTSIHLNRPGRWIYELEDTNRQGAVHAFAFYQVAFADFSNLPAGYRWVRFSDGNVDISAAQPIDRYVQWALGKFLTYRAQSSSLSQVGLRTALPASRVVPRSPVSQAPQSRPASQVAQGRVMALYIPKVGEDKRQLYHPYPPIQGWYAFKDAVWFDRDAEPAFAFTNFYQSPINIANFYTNKVESWPAVENYFQAMKTDDSAIQGRLRTLSPAQALDDKPMARDWWGNVRFQVMRKALDAKFAPGTQLASKLLSTEGRVLVEKTYGRRDKEVAWGADDGFGENHLGRMLMVIRDSLRDGVHYSYDPERTYSLGRIEQMLAAGYDLSGAR